jgi:outer membrane protein OmpA-like peptidoglycan-associated protein
MRRTYQFLLATAIVAAPLPVAAQVSVDLNALNRLGAASLPTPPPPRAALHRYRHTRHLLAHTEPGGLDGRATAVATAAPTGPDAIEHPANLGPSFASLPLLPGAAPPALPPALTDAATPLALPTGAPPPPHALAAPASKPATPARLAEATPPPPAARPAPQRAAPDALPKGADGLTLPFFVDESDLPAAETAMLRDFAGRYGAAAHYIVRAFATSPAGDDDPSTPRRIALARAQSVATALAGSGVPPDRVRLLALGSAGGTPPDRVEVIAIPPSSGHTNIDSSP